jgi:taurine transport system ATP-binding protein
VTLALRDIRLEYARGRRILDGVSLAIEPGELVTVIGPSGSGKTSLLRLAAGFVRPTAGAVTLAGQPVLGPGADRAVVFQEDALFPWLPVRENVAFALRVRGTPKDERDRQAEETLRLVGLKGYGERRVWEPRPVRPHHRVHPPDPALGLPASGRDLVWYR